MFRVLLKITTPVFLQYTKEKFFTKILHALLLSNQVNCFQNHVERNLSKLLNRRLKNSKMETSPLTWQNTSEKERHKLGIFQGEIYSRKFELWYD